MALTMPAVSRSRQNKSVRILNRMIRYATNANITMVVHRKFQNVLHTSRAPRENVDGDAIRSTPVGATATNLYAMPRFDIPRAPCR